MSAAIEDAARMAMKAAPAPERDALVRVRLCENPSAGLRRLGMVMAKIVHKNGAIQYVALPEEAVVEPAEAT